MSFGLPSDRPSGAGCASFRRDVAGLSTVEYILILVLVAVGAIILWRLFGGTMNAKVEEASGSVSSLEEGVQRRSSVGSGETAGTQAASATAAGRLDDRRRSKTGGEDTSESDDEASIGAAVASTGAAAGAPGSGGAPTDPAAAEAAGGIEIDDGPDLFTWIGGFIVLLLLVVTMFSVLSKRAGKG